MPIISVIFGEEKLRVLLRKHLHRVALKVTSANHNHISIEYSVIVTEASGGLIGQNGVRPRPCGLPWYDKVSDWSSLAAMAEFRAMKIFSWLQL